MSAQAAPFDFEAASKRLLKLMRIEDRALSLGELAVIAHEPAHRVLLALEAPRREHLVSINGGGLWELEGPRTPLPQPDDAQASLPA